RGDAVRLVAERSGHRACRHGGAVDVLHADREHGLPYRHAALSAIGVVRQNSYVASALSLVSFCQSGYFLSVRPAEAGGKEPSSSIGRQYCSLLVKSKWG